MNEFQHGKQKFLTRWILCNNLLSYVVWALDVQVRSHQVLRFQQYDIPVGPEHVAGTLLHGVSWYCVCVERVCKCVSVWIPRFSESHAFVFNMQGQNTMSQQNTHNVFKHTLTLMRAPVQCQFKKLWSIILAVRLICSRFGDYLGLHSSWTTALLTSLSSATVSGKIWLALFQVHILQARHIAPAWGSIQRSQQE